MCEARGLPWVRIGVVDTDELDAALDVQDVLTVPLTEPARRLRGDAAGAVRLGRLNSSVV